MKIPGFTISVGTCERFLVDGWPDGLDAEVGRHSERLGESLGRRFGDQSWAVPYR